MVRRTSLLAQRWSASASNTAIPRISSATTGSGSQLSRSLIHVSAGLSESMRLSYHSCLCGKYAYYPSASTCSRWTRPRSGGKTPALQRDLMRDADENFPAQIVHLVEFADIRDPILDLDVRRACWRGRVRPPVLS